MLGVEWMDTGHRRVESYVAYELISLAKDASARTKCLDTQVCNIRLVEEWFSFATAKQHSAKESRCKNTTPDA